ncbi:succinylglutamate desuccinylase [Salinimonas sp. HHU 13199]|uniref:Succinylglutamate desuccinylase n=1 Tax=Salinimonas profundi TaxID=2729140 RepID=A0ABR8LLG3_9ALTE|nr:succinylglutamate desuccinylase [Salinimonas profundi]MBD3584930.1 succinylglutamate desuccinylase [Salinimonas profundi]
MQAELIQSGDFLHRSRTQPSSFEHPLSFTLDNGVQVNIQAPGIIAFEPAKPADTPKSIVLSCGVHGNETAPIELCDAWVANILTQKMTPAHRILFLFGNLPAMDIAERFVDENMNRLFSGAHSDGQGLINAERHRAKALEEAVTSFFAGASAERLHYDLHTAIRESKNEKFAVYPFLHERTHSREQIAFLAACGVKTILLSQSPTTTFSYYSSHVHQAHAFTVELGKVRPFGENDMSRFEDARVAITALIAEADYAPEVDLETVEIYTVNQVINKQKEDFKLHFADDTPNFTDFKAGTVLATETGAEYVAQQDGEAIVFPNANVAIGQRAILTVVPTSLGSDNV